MRETLVVDASIAIKWVVEEEGTAEAVALRTRFTFAAPDLILAECANILWKKVQRSELTDEEARLAICLIERAGIELASMAGFAEEAMALAVALSHPAYDCMYLALASRRKLRFVTADRRLLSTIAQRGAEELSALCLPLDRF